MRAHLISRQRTFTRGLQQRLLLCLFGCVVSATALASDDYVPASPEHRAGSAEYDLAPFVSWLRKGYSERNIPGVAMAVVSQDSILQLETWGVRDVRSVEEIDAETVFRIASMSKTFGGTASAILVQQNLLSWDTRIADLYPSMTIGTGGSSRQITFGQVVSQSTGLMPHSYSNMLDGGVVYDDIKSKFDEIPTVCAPGDCYGYQNVVFSLIADVVETTTGNSYEEFVELNLFEPLGMRSASLGLEAFEASENVTAPHRKTRSGWRATSNNPAYYSVAPAAGINASISDMALWLQAHLGAFPDVLSPSLLTSIHRPAIATPYGNYFNRWEGLDEAHYARGWRVFDFDGLRVIHHGGGVRGFRSEMALIPEAGIAVVLLFNGETNFANDVVPTFVDTLSQSQ